MDSYQPDVLTAYTSRSKQRDILGLLGFGFYILFTLLPNGSSLLVSWPWVFIWQVALLLPWLWLLRDWWTQNQIAKLGYKLDYGMGLALVGLMGSTVLAPFPQQARWYSWAALCAIAALYALNAWCESPIRRRALLMAQGKLSLAFIVVSLSLWTSQTLLPELNRLAELRAVGLELPFDFSVLELRNWAPIGHQNYVAGYLVLSLPLLLGLSLTTPSKWKWMWGIGVVLGLVDLYTTSSRAGWLGIALIAGVGSCLLLGNRRLPLWWRGLAGLIFLAGLVGMLLANNRLRSLFSVSSLDTGGETAFRLITNTAGWAMGLDHPFFGVGPGGVSMLYQSYRPVWAGREAELVYQLHSTPAQIWAEFGGIGVALSLGLLGWLGYWGFRLWRSQPKDWSQDRILAWSLFAGLAGYGVVSITDYQLDIVCISGTLIVYMVGLLSLLRQYSPTNITTTLPKSLRLSWLCSGIVGLLIAVGIWLVPIHRAWQLSSLGFTAVERKQIEPFTSYLEQAHQLVPWEPYYSYQLGWHLSPLKAQSENAQVNQTRLEESLEFFTCNVKTSPHQESGMSSLGWLQLFSHQAPQATASFLESSELIPAKHGVFHSLGISLLEQNQTNLAIQALALEIVRDPLWISSPLWRSQQFAPIYPQVQTAVVRLYQHMLNNRSAQDSFTTYLHQALGGVYWWQGKLTEAETQWKTEGTPLGKSVLAIAQQKQPTTDVPILKAWLDPQTRTQWIEKALLQTNKSQPDPKLVQALRTSMDQSKTLDEWVKKNAPTRQFLRERTGFGVLSRHIDGPAPSDFLPLAENMAVTQFFTNLLPSPSYSPDLDNALQPFRKQLWESIARTQSR